MGGMSKPRSSMGERQLLDQSMSIIAKGGQREARGIGGQREARGIGTGSMLPIVLLEHNLKSIFNKLVFLL